MKYGLMSGLNRLQSRMSPARPLPVSVRRWHRTISAFGNRHYPGGERLFDAAGEIAVLSDTFGALLSKYTPVKEEMDFFLQFTHPLQIISRYGPFEDIGQAMKTLYAERENLIDEAFEPPAERSSLRERLQAAIRESSRMGVPDPDKKPHHEKER